MARAMSGSWKVTLPCTRSEAEAIDTSGDLPIDPQPVLMTSEEVADDPGRWRLDAYFEQEPDADAIAAIIALAPSARVKPKIEQLGDEDWAKLSQAGLEPIREGRFVVHTPAHPVDPPLGGRAFVIDAGRAFGTGHHETTAGCLAALVQLAEARFNSVVDLGTGTGLLAFAARHLWPDAAVVATDIDPVAIEVTRDNMMLNAVDRVELVVADGTRDQAITRHAPFDLVIANILAAPLIAMAPEIAAISAPGASILLAGLLDAQSDAVIAAYRVVGCEVARADRRGEWTILLLRASSKAFVSPAIDHGALNGRHGWATDG